jgi:hypothetical protein
MNSQVCEYCSQCVESNEPRMTSMCVVKRKDTIHEFGITTCAPCHGILKALPTDLGGKCVFPDDTQIVLYKVKKYLFPSKRLDKKLKEWQLFSPVHTKGKKQDYK